MLEKQDVVVENDNSKVPSTETNETEKTQSVEGELNTQPEEKKVPFHEDPQVQDYINRQLEAREAKLKEELDSRYKIPESKVEVPSWFGGDEDSWNQYQAHTEARDAKVREAALREFQGLTQKEQKLIQDANDWFESSVKEIERSENTTVDRNVLLKTAQDFELIDSKGRWNWKAAHKIASSQYKADPTKVDQRKKIVGMDKNDQGQESGKEVMTNVDFRKPGKRPW